MQKAEAQKEHHWLQKLVGDWTSAMEATMGPGEQAVTSSGTETVRSLGGLWVMCEGQSSMPDGSTGQTVMTLGYDAQKQRFVGSFIGSMMTMMWIYEGSLDSSGRILTLDTVGPSFAGDGKMSKYQDIIEFKSDDHRLLRSQMLGDDGKWTGFMTVHYRRRS